MYQKCPICEGTGNVAGGFYNSLPGCNWISGQASEQCRSCTGTGIVTVANNSEVSYTFSHPMLNNEPQEDASFADKLEQDLKDIVSLLDILHNQHDELFYHEKGFKRLREKYLYDEE